MFALSLRNVLAAAVLIAVVSACARAWETSEEHVAATSQAESSWQATQELSPADLPFTSAFGQAIAATETTLVVADHVAQALYVFERGPREWTQTAKLVPPADGKKTIDFAWTFAAAEGYVFVRRSTVEDLTAGHHGRVLVFAKTATGWQLTQQIASDPNPYEKFGFGMTLHGTTLAIGAREDRANGSVYIFERVGETFVPKQKIQPIKGDLRREAFGSALTFGNGVLVIGSLSEEGGPNPLESQGAFYAYTNDGGAWTLEGRHPVQGGDGNSLCFAGDALAGGTNLRAEAIVFRRRPRGFVRETPLPVTGASASRVLCAGGRIAAFPIGLTAPIALFSPQGTGWTRDELIVGQGSFTGIAMNEDTLFVGMTASPPRVRVLSFGKLVGERCTNDNACAGRACVDGVCCESACGRGDANDCQACSRAAGAAVDGRCEVLPTTHVCRKQRATCDVADSCDGTGTKCPADSVEANGAPCSEGVCTNGTCLARTDAPPPPPMTEPNPEAPSDDSSGCRVGAPRASPGFTLLSAFVALAACLRRRRRTGARERR